MEKDTPSSDHANSAKEMAFKDTQLFIATLADCQLISVV
jgi:hypothetical protein